MLCRLPPQMLTALVFGMTCSPYSILCLQCFLSEHVGPLFARAGKEEDGGFSFTQEPIDDIILLFAVSLTGAAGIDVANLPPLAGHFLRPFVHLCISGASLPSTQQINPITRLMDGETPCTDVNKTLLVQSAGLIPLLLDGTFLDADHPRTDAPDSEKAPLQTDVCDCFVQLAVFEPGRELLQSDPAAMDALRALADGKALTEEGKLSAHSALVAIEGVTREPEPEMEGAEEADLHIMASYQWVRQAASDNSHPCPAIYSTRTLSSVLLSSHGSDPFAVQDVQVTIERIVRSLQKRKYLLRSTFAGTKYTVDT